MGESASSKFNHNPVQTSIKFVIFGFDSTLMSISGAAERTGLVVYKYARSGLHSLTIACTFCLFREDVRGVAGVALATPFFRDFIRTSGHQAI